MAFCLVVLAALGLRIAVVAAAADTQVMVGLADRVWLL
jgi:hypothetical protein